MAQLTPLQRWLRRPKNVGWLARMMGIKRARCRTYVTRQVVPDPEALARLQRITELKIEELIPVFPILPRRPRGAWRTAGHALPFAELPTYQGRRKRPARPAREPDVA
jgi:hypothetical protein